jgi:hypothetical protein
MKMRHPEHYNSQKAPDSDSSRQVTQVANSWLKFEILLLLIHLIKLNLAYTAIGSAN